ncbi:ankyrin repeat domain-containing protein [Endozoicomonas sp. 8E]|uniref:ankyrin repeat domain-containing protein n=1 Tax=Endozoicomonas sp. 8E TaxID=3035692 RepID=UPI002938F9E2|nr:ankyrin repeat domain-containing protein [Endozoicomonas sp. 8E]WOG28594.1 ankyrin repeat domain-containing protein [Endozoicomonas sp. 8E]
MDAIAPSPLPMSTELTSKADVCSICHGGFHGRNVAPVNLNPKCQTHCGHYFHLHCITGQFVDEPLGSRRCKLCRQNPIPVLNTSTGESYPDKFFADQRFRSACCSRDLKQVQKLLEEGVNINAVMNAGFTALMIASSEGFTDLAELLIRHGADVNAARAEDGVTALFLTAQNNDPDVTRLLISARADPNIPRTSDGATPLAIAVQEGCTECVKLLLQAGAFTSAVLSSGMTLLYIAALRGNTDCLKLLLKAGLDPNDASSIGITPLYIAALKGNTDCVKLLIDAGANINARTKNGSTPLSIATRMGNTDCVKVLIETGKSQEAKEKHDVLQ